MNLRRRNVLLLLEQYDHGFRNGIGQFAAEHKWIVTVNDGCTLPDGWHGDGIITYFDKRKDIIRYVTTAKVPVVNLSGFRPDIALPSVTGDNVGIGRMAAEFFHPKGFTHAAYFATQFRRLQKLRLHGFAARWKELTGNKITPMVPALDKLRTRADDWTALSAYIRKKLSVIPKPLAVFAYCDYDAAKVETAVLEADLRLPEDVAILGVDNDPLICENESVTLSSICHDRTRVGYEGAALLERLMSNEVVAEQTHMILPSRIAERASTRGIYSDDPLIQRVIAHFAQNLSRRVGLSEAAAEVGVNPRQLERHFARHTNRTVMSYLRELRLLRANMLLLETDLNLCEISTRCGFSNAQHFSNTFRETYGLTPSQARAEKHAMGQIVNRDMI